jgi:hypothetical protein
LFSVVVPRRHTPAADACYYNDYDFYDLTARKSAQRRRCERSARLHFIQKEKPIVFAVLECFSRKPARALAKATWTEIGHRKGQGKERKRKRGKWAKKENGVPSKLLLEEKAVRILGLLFGCRMARRCQRSRDFRAVFLSLAGAKVGWVALDCDNTS